VRFQPPNKIKEMAEAKAPIEDIAREMRCSVATAQRRLKMIPEEITEIREAVKVKRTMAPDEAASIYGVSQRTIERICKR
jgi:DNA-binding transcriptional regulator YiaG